MIDASIAVIDLTTRVASESMSNQSLRERFGLPDEKKNGVAISRLIRGRSENKLIEEEDGDAGRGAAWAGPGGTDQLICDYLRNHGNSRTAVISKSLGIPDRTIRDGMRRLVDRGIVEAHGSNRNRTYSPKGQQARPISSYRVIGAGYGSCSRLTLFCIGDNRERVSGT